MAYKTIIPKQSRAYQFYESLEDVLEDVSEAGRESVSPTELAAPPRALRRTVSQVGFVATFR
jgi:hypothetical protein